MKSTEEIELKVEDYKKHIFKRLDRFIDTKSVKEMMFIKKEVLCLMNEINDKRIPISGLIFHLDMFIDVGIHKQDKDEDYGTLKMFIEKDFFEKI